MIFFKDSLATIKGLIEDILVGIVIDSVTVRVDFIATLSFLLLFFSGYIG